MSYLIPAKRGQPEPDPYKTPSPCHFVGAGRRARPILSLATEQVFSNSSANLPDPLADDGYRARLERLVTW